MKPPTIPETFRICRACEDALATEAGLCEDCQRVRRMLRDAYPEEALCPCGCGFPVEVTMDFPRLGASPVRITEMPRPLARPLPAMVSREQYHSALRWVSIAGIGTFVLGFVFGKMCH